MTHSVLCPRGHTVTLDEAPRRVIACPRCGTVFSATDASAPLPPSLPGAMAARPARPSRDEDEDADEDVRPRRRKRRDDDDDDDDDRDKVRKGPPPKRKPVARRKVEEEPEDEEEEEESAGPVLTRKQRQMSLVRLGVLFHIIKLWIFLAAIVLGMVAFPLVIVLLIFGGRFGRLFISITSNLATSVAPLLGIVGSILCARIPVRSEARGTIIVSCAFDALAPLFGLFQLVLILANLGATDERIDNLINYMDLARLACTLIAWWLFQLYLRKLSFYMRETLLASESLNVIVWFLLGVVVGPTLVVATALITGFIFFALVGWMIYWLVMFPIKQFRLLFAIRTKIFEKYLKVDDDD